MNKIEAAQDSRITRDPKTGAVRTLFNLSAQPATKEALSMDDREAPLKAGELSRQVLKENADVFKWQPDLPNLRQGEVLSSENGYSARYTQNFKGVPVDSSEVVVNIDKEGRVYSIDNKYHYDIPDSIDPKNAKISSGQAADIVHDLAKVYEKYETSQPNLIIYQYKQTRNNPPKTPARPTNHREAFLGAVASRTAEMKSISEPPKEGEYFLAWDIIVSTRKPDGLWRVLVNAMTGSLINVIDLVQYESGTGKVFDPNPIVTSGDTGLSTTTQSATLNSFCIAVNLDRLDPKDTTGNLHLDGPYVHMDELETPTHSEPVSPTGDFNFD